LVDGFYLAYSEHYEPVASWLQLPFLFLLTPY
jgi:hypothetical protein